MQEAARSRYNDVLDFDSSSAILKIEWREEVREEGLGFTGHVQPFLSPVTMMYNSSQRHSQSFTKNASANGQPFKLGKSQHNPMS